MSDLTQYEVRDIIDINRGYAFSSEDYRQEGIAILRVSNIQGNGQIDDDYIFLESSLSERYKNYLVEPDDILLVMVGATTGKLGYVRTQNVPALLNQNIWNLKPTSLIDKGYLKYKSSEIVDAYLSVAQGSARDFLKQGDFDKYPVKIHEDLIQQQKIAKILSTVDNLIEKTQTLIDKYTAIKQGMMADLFTRGIDMTTGDTANSKGGKLRSSIEDAPELYKQTELGWVPKDWEVVRFGDVVEVIDPNPSHRYPEASNEGIPLCSTESFAGEDYIIIKKPKLVPLQTFEEQNLRCRFSETDVIFARKGRIGLARRYGRERKAFSHTVVVMKPASKVVDKNWLLWVSRSYGFLHFIENTMNTNLGVPTLGVDFIKKVPIVCPDVVEQKQVAERLDNLTSLINIQADELAKYQSKKKGLMQDLLTGKVRVN